MNGNYTILMPIDDSFDGMMEASNFQGGQYKKMGDRAFPRICESLYNDSIRSYWDDFQASQLHPVPWKTCPYPTGRNEITNFLISDYADFLPPYVPGSEKWRVDVYYTKNGEIYGGFRLFLIFRNHNSLLVNGG